uniref:NDP-4-keto-6-deoxyhexose 5-epimerase n=1 Tax=Streptomyces venezuelae (strain ATCC 10712 / CBS 650.69 / DSM 40230 / JCM 4526 / NBRC 13096 / PD 04745) TaxID=953739 RepID=Q939Q4_STRVP|nr:NDP-4-keto-6-deoxyhexose 5-epimerase [Streptomyces venezuelae ATCC 10712]
MQVTPLAIEGAFAFTPPVFKDSRGLFASPYQGDVFAGQLGRPLFQVNQVSHNLSARGTLRGVHFTATPPGMAKYVYCPYGRLRDFLIDLRVGSPTFGQWVMNELDAETSRALYVPVGVGHAFVSLQDDSMCVYVMSQGYSPPTNWPCTRSTRRSDLPAGRRRADPVRPDKIAPTLAEARDRGLLPDFDTCRKLEELL